MAGVPVTTANRIGQQQVCLLDGQETSRVALRCIGVEALGHAAMSSLDLGQRGGTLDTKDAIGIRDVLHTAHDCDRRMRFVLDELGDGRQHEAGHRLRHERACGRAHLRSMV